jgi:hypothetical protein
VAKSPHSLKAGMEAKNPSWMSAESLMPKSEPFVFWIIGGDTQQLPNPAQVLTSVIIK